LTAAGDQEPAHEGGLEGGADRLAAIDDGQDRALRIEAPPDQVVEQGLADSLDLSTALPQPQRGLPPSDSTPKAATIVCSAVSIPSMKIASRSVPQSSRPISSCSFRAVPATKLARASRVRRLLPPPAQWVPAQLDS